MPRFTKKALLLVVLILLLCHPALAQPRGAAGPVPPELAPRWAQVPEAPGVYYAPNLSQDLFRYGNLFYSYSQGLWQIAQALTGPWQVIQNPPPIFHNIGPTYFKSPPGWDRGRKTGWGGAPMPPGQMKKMERGGSLPPGQMKKFE
jgi:hypothetical protein